ncbi:MAG: hypothetical protein CMJ83_06670 [Planctomycetes bacterium]|nr:hypothetical protein [Planctomycetota bacterium]
MGYPQRAPREDQPEVLDLQVCIRPLHRLHRWFMTSPVGTGSVLFGSHGQNPSRGTQRTPLGGELTKLREDAELPQQEKRRKQ